MNHGVRGTRKEEVRTIMKSGKRVNLDDIPVQSGRTLGEIAVLSNQTF